jgi:hypothetical protein
VPAHLPTHMCSLQGQICDELLVPTNVLKDVAFSSLGRRWRFSNTVEPKVSYIEFTLHNMRKLNTLLRRPTHN